MLTYKNILFFLAVSGMIPLQAMRDSAGIELINKTIQANEQTSLVPRDAECCTTRRKKILFGIGSIAIGVRDSIGQAAGLQQHLKP